MATYSERIRAKGNRRVPKSIPIEFLIPNKKAPQNAKYSVLRGIVLPAAGVEPARSRMFIELIWNCAKFRVKKWLKNIKKKPLYAYKRTNNIMVIYGYKRIM